MLNVNGIYSLCFIIIINLREVGGDGEEEHSIAILNFSLRLKVTGFTTTNIIH